MADASVDEIWAELRRQSWRAPSPIEAFRNRDPNLMFVQDPENSRSLWIVGPYLAVRDFEHVFNSGIYTQIEKRELDENLAQFGATHRLGRRGSDVTDPNSRRELAAKSVRPHGLPDRRAPGQELKWNEFVQAHHIVEKDGCLKELGVDRDELTAANAPAFMALGEFHQEVFTKEGRKSRPIFEELGKALKGGPISLPTKSLQMLHELRGQLDDVRAKLVRGKLEDFEKKRVSLGDKLEKIKFGKHNLWTVLAQLQTTANDLYKLEEGLGPLRYIAYNINIRAIRKIIEGLERSAGT